MRLLTGLAALLFCLSVPAYAEDTAPTDVANDTTEEKEQLQVEGRDLVLSWEEKDSLGNSIKEFIPGDETLDHWTRLVGVFQYPDIDSPREFADGMIEQLKRREPPANYELLANEETGDVLLDFVVWPEDVTYVEFDVFQFCKNEDGGITAYQYALRGYDDDKEKFVADLQPDRRAELIAALLTTVADIAGDEADATAATNDQNGEAAATADTSPASDDANPDAAGNTPDEVPAQNR